MIKQMFLSVEERNNKIRENMKSKSEAQVSSKHQARLLSPMDLEKSKLKIALSHPSTWSVTFAVGFKTINLTMDAKRIPLPDKINLHMQTKQLIFHDLYKSASSASNAENMMEKVVNQ